MRGKMILFIFASVFLFAGCAMEAVKPPITSSAPITPAEVARTSWEEEWEKIVQRAKKEGTLALYTSTTPEARADIVEAFQAKYGISVEVISGRGPEVISKLSMERQSGVYWADVYFGGGEPIITMLKPKGIIEPQLDRIFLLPEILNPQMWYEGKLPFVDSARTTLTLSLSPSKPIWINASKVMPGELKSYMDFLKPKWKNEILINDPTVSGMGNQWFSVFGGNLLGYDYMRELAKQNPVLLRDKRLQAEWLARGKYSISIALGWSSFEPFITLGVPIQVISLVEGDYLSGASSHIALINKAAHPNAAKLFINWLASKEGSTVLAKGYQRQSSRLDVPIEFEGVKLLSFREPGVKYFITDSEDFILKRDAYMEKAKEIFGQLLK